MYDFLLTAEPEDRAAERERQRRILANLPRNSTSAAYLLHRATALYDVQVRLEDAAIAMKDMQGDAAHAAGCKTGVKHLANTIPQLTSEIGHLTLAARYDMDCVSEGADLDVEVPGVPLSVQKAARALHKQKEDAIKKASEEQACLQANANAMAFQQKQNQPSSALPGATVAAAGSGGTTFPRPVQAYNRTRYPCDACGVRGHWKAKDVCRPEDLQAYTAQLALHAPPAAVALNLPALPPPPGTSGRHY
jgi:hypothetical protein